MSPGPAMTGRYDLRGAAKRVPPAMLLAVLAACTADDTNDTAAADAAGPVERIGFFYRGGEDRPHPATGIFGDIADSVRVHQVAVLSLHPSVPARTTPVVMLPGFGIAVETFLQTPDGRPGWAMELVAEGYTVYLVEPSHTTRSGIDSAAYRGSDATGTLFTWGREHVWTRWGLGPEYGVAAADGRFPVDAWDQVVASFTAIETDVVDGAHNIAYQLDSNVAGITAVLEEIGPAIIFTHSASGVPVFAVANRTPGLVAAIVAIEPVGCPAADGAVFDRLPVLAVFGDHMQWRPQMPERRDQCRAVVDAVAARSLPARMLDLPAMGIEGNSHLLYLEDNSSDLLALVLDWLEDADVD